MGRRRDGSRHDSRDRSDREDRRWASGRDPARRRRGSSPGSSPDAGRRARGRFRDARRPRRSRSRSRDRRARRSESPAGGRGAPARRRFGRRARSGSSSGGGGSSRGRRSRSGSTPSSTDLSDAAVGIPEIPELAASELRTVFFHFSLAYCFSPVGLYVPGPPRTI
ncbi:hypothetical protein DIPPA_31669 [Diplonema papillatum]|nr:hypothetical protein DIPPA_31669 [Diplonema papillatum]